jgi:hypothetical protein
MTPEVADKFRQVLQLSSQIAPLNRKLKRTPDEVVALQSLLRRRTELLGTLPGLRVVAGKDVP